VGRDETALSTRAGNGAVTRRPTCGDIRDLVALAVAGLRTMERDDGIFCLEVVPGSDAPLGESLRYTLMTAIGLTKATRAGYDHGFDVDRIRAELLHRVDSPALAPGDLGLYLWLDALHGAPAGEMLTTKLRERLDASGGLTRREGMELGWIVYGLALAAADGDVSPLLRESLDVLLVRNQAPSGLFHHYATGSFRRRFPNFATQIYSVLALATVAKHELDERAAPAARRGADRLLELQRPNGGWPWVFDTATGRVVEPFHVYSVHQHAMAPMGLLQLAEAVGDDRYAAAAVRGVPWIYGDNELRRTMVDQRRSVVYRSIRRRSLLGPGALAVNTAAAAAVRRRVWGDVGPLELNATCRPYELGWLLEAWCGRESVVDSVNP
jgi:hypothetical protein